MNDRDFIISWHLKLQATGCLHPYQVICQSLLFSVEIHGVAEAGRSLLAGCQNQLLEALGMEPGYSHLSDSGGSEN